MSVRCAWLGFLALAFCLPLHASEPVHVVKFINFNCAVCRASESIDAPIRELAESGGGRFVVAPLPRGRNDARERVYYALRSIDANVELGLRRSLYEASQDLNFPLSDTAQTIDWLRGELPDALDWSRVATLANTAEPSAAVDRAVKLAVRAGLQRVPTYILVQGESVLDTVDPQSVGDLASLREAVLTALRKTRAPKS